MFILCAISAGWIGCGGSPGDRRAELPAEQRVVDSFLYGIVQGDPAAVLSALPPARLDEIRGDMRHATDEEIGTVLMDALRFDFPYTGIGEISYRTEEMEGGTSVVFYWGEFEGADASGRKTTVNEADARSFNLINLDGTWYLAV